MKIFIIHNRYRHRAGEDSVFDQEVSLLQKHGHQVKTLIADNLDIQSQTTWQKIKLAVNTIWSQKSHQDVTKYLQEFQPDIVHVHNFLPLLSPSIFYACKRQNIPVIQTIHNYRLGCPAATFFRHGKICELCVQKNLLASIYHRCYRESYLQTATVAMMLQIHRWLGTWNNVVTAYIALTPFVKQKLIEIGIPEHKIYIKPNFLANPQPNPKTPEFGKHYLYVGRLVPEKGIHILLEAYQQSNSQYPLIIIGSGELQPLVEEAAKYNPHIQYLGQQPRAIVLEYMRQAIALIFPSIWYEGFPLTILEAYSQSLPVVGSDIGSVSYAIENGVTGLTFPVGDEQALSQIFSSIEADPKKWIELKEKVLDSLSDTYFPNHNIDCLLEIYRNVISS
jgi:glycosyltransferase involved in cell wall biosynthesis